MTALERSRAQPNDTAAAPSGSNELIKLIRKLRWVGMEDEAERLQAELTQRQTAAADSVVATQGETD
jgi:hypothetical protein